MAPCASLRKAVSDGTMIWAATRGWRGLDGIKAVWHRIGDIRIGGAEVQVRRLRLAISVGEAWGLSEIGGRAEWNIHILAGAV